MAQYRIYFTVTESGYIEFGEESEAQAAYQKLCSTHCSVEDVGGITKWREYDTEVEPPARYN